MNICMYVFIHTYVYRKQMGDFAWDVVPHGVTHAYALLKSLPPLRGCARVCPRANFMSYVHLLPGSCCAAHAHVSVLRRALAHATCSHRPHSVSQTVMDADWLCAADVVTRDAERPPQTPRSHHTPRRCGVARRGSGRAGFRHAS
jgi:hypothetical protein